MVTHVINTTQPEITKILITVEAEVHSRLPHVGRYDHERQFDGGLVIVVRGRDVDAAIDAAMTRPMLPADKPRRKYVYLTCPNCGEAMASSPKFVHIEAGHAVVRIGYIVYCDFCHDWSTAGERLEVA